eukprot:3586239-Prymnesium_polylepis.1
MTYCGRTWLPHQNAAKRGRNPTSLHAAHAHPPTAFAPRARLHMPPQRTPAGELAPARHPSVPSTRLAAARPRPPRPLQVALLCA